MKTIVVLSHSPYIGGAELALKSLIESTGDIYSWTLIIPSHLKIDEKVKPKNTKFIYIPDLPWWCYEAHDHPKTIDKQKLNMSLDMLKNIAVSADILLTNTITIPWLGFIAQELGKPHIWYVHEFGDLDHNLQFIAGYHESLMMIDNCSSRVLTISEAVKEHIGKVVHHSKIDIIHQSIDLAELTQIPLANSSSVQRLLCLGAVKPSKGQSIALEAVSRLPDLQLDIIGPAADPNYAKTLLKKAASIPNVNVELRSYNPVDELSSHDVLLMCSENEGLGRVTLEALAAGRFVVGYASPSTKELLSDSRGLLYSPNKSNSLTEKLKNLHVIHSTVNPIKGREYVTQVFNDKVQANDFTFSVNNALKAKIEKSKNLSDYTRILDEHGLWVTKKQQLLHTLKSFLPSPIKHAIKRIIGIF